MSNRSLITLINNEPRANTLEIAQGFGREHKNVLRLVKKYKSHFEKLGVLRERRFKTKGTPFNTFDLNEDQSIFLGTLFDNSDVVVAYKLRLTQEFSRMRKELMRIASNQSNAQWLEARQQGKQTRLEQTDVIKAFVDYATAQGSKSANMYYMNLTKMENKALFVLDQKYPNIREVLDYRQVGVMSSADQVVERALKEGMDKSLHYKQVYILAKDRVHEFARIIGKSVIPEQARLAA